MKLKKKVKMASAMADNLDLTGLLEAIRKDKYGFSLREEEGTDGILIRLVRKWNETLEQARPPQSLFKKAVIAVVDRMLELQFWDELNRVESSVTCPDYLLEKLKTFKIAMKVSPLIKTQRKQLYDVFTREQETQTVSDLKDQVRSLRGKNVSREMVYGFLELTKDERSMIIQLINPDVEEVDDGDDETCLICYALPKTHKMACGHFVCENCFKGFKRHSQSCPFCRGTIE